MDGVGAEHSTAAGDAEVKAERPELLREGGRAGSPGRKALRGVRGLVVAEVALALILVVAAAEVVVGLSIVVAIFKSRATTDLDQNVALRK